MKTCIECLRQVHRLWGRGLCMRCHQQARRAGRLDEYPSRAGVSREVVLQEWPLLRAEGYTVPQAAARLGMSPDALWAALSRARRAGDPRAQFDWRGWSEHKREQRAAKVRAAAKTVIAEDRKLLDQLAS